MNVIVYLTAVPGPGGLQGNREQTRREHANDTGWAKEFGSRSARWRDLFERCGVPNSGSGSKPQVPSRYFPTIHANPRRRAGAGSNPNHLGSRS
jgi:hypothetical protein